MTGTSTTVKMMSLMVVLVVVAALAAPTPARGRQEQGAQPTVVVDGSDVYKTYCASCHGRSGRGDGTIAKYLKPPPADLTQIAKRSKGAFPAERVFQVIDGRQVVKGHGDRQMPVWGDAFSKSLTGSDEASIKAKIEALVKHLESIQAR